MGGVDCDKGRVSDKADTFSVVEGRVVGGGYTVRGFDRRRIGPVLADTNPDTAWTWTGRTGNGGNKSVLLNLEYQFVVNNSARIITFYDAGQVQDFGNKFVSDDFKTSTGVELRIFMPMLGVPFRLIYYFNPMRDGVYTDRLYPQAGRGLRFSMG